MGPKNKSGGHPKNKALPSKVPSPGEESATTRGLPPNPSQGLPEEGSGAGATKPTKDDTALGTNQGSPRTEGNPATAGLNEGDEDQGNQDREQELEEDKGQSSREQEQAEGVCVPEPREEDWTILNRQSPPFESTFRSPRKSQAKRPRKKAQARKPPPTPVPTTDFTAMFACMDRYFEMKRREARESRRDMSRKRKRSPSPWDSDCSSYASDEGYLMEIKEEKRWDHQSGRLAEGPNSRERKGHQSHALSRGRAAYLSPTQAMRGEEGQTHALSGGRAPFPSSKKAYSRRPTASTRSAQSAASTPLAENSAQRAARQGEHSAHRATASTTGPGLEPHAQPGSSQSTGSLRAGAHARRPDSDWQQGETSSRPGSSGAPPHSLPVGFPSYATLKPATSGYHEYISLVSSESEEDLDSASVTGSVAVVHSEDPRDSASLAPSVVSQTSNPAANKEEEAKDDNKEVSLASKGLEAHTKSLLAKLKPLTNGIIIERENKARQSYDLGQWAEVGVGRAQQPHLAFASSRTVDAAVNWEFDKAINDRYSQSHNPKGVPLICPKDRFARYQGDGSRPAGPAEINLLQSFLPSAHPRKETSAAGKALRTHEDTARRFLNGLNQLDALKNAAAATMLQRTDDDSDNRKWKDGADPNLLLDILHCQHQSIEHLAQLAGHYFCSTLLDRRAAALAEAVAPREIQKTLLTSPPFSAALFDEEHMQRAKKDLESTAVTKSLAKGSFNPYKRQPSQFAAKRKEPNARRPIAPSRPRPSATATGPTPQQQSRPATFGAQKSFRPSFPKGNFPRGRMLPGRKK